MEELIIDNEFKSLIHPLRPKEYEQLEKNILKDGCRDSIITWKRIIVDGHNRYEICQKHKLPFNIIEMNFNSRDEAIVWICANQLGRRNITDETRRFLIGMQYETEKIISYDRNKERINQYSINNDVTKHIVDHMGRTADRIGAENNISGGTVRKYAQYAKSLAKIGSIVPELETDILSGSIKVSQENVCELANKGAEELKMIHSRLEKSSGLVKKGFGNTRGALQQRNDVRIASIGSIKEMPEYDPNAEYTKLALTIPSWIGTLQHAKSTTEVKKTTAEVQLKLKNALLDLEATICSVISSLEEDK